MVNNSWSECMAMFRPIHSYHMCLSRNTPYYEVGRDYHPIMTAEMVAYWGRFIRVLGNYMNSARNTLAPAVENNSRLLPLSRSILSSLERNNRALLARAPGGWYAYDVAENLPLSAGVQRPFLSFPPPITKNKGNVEEEYSQRVRNVRGKQLAHPSQGVVIRENDESEVAQDTGSAAGAGDPLSTPSKSQAAPSKAPSEKRKAFASSAVAAKSKQFSFHALAHPLMLLCLPQQPHLFEISQKRNLMKVLMV
ncbi:hypothetical protein COLO4_36196 [Corchorus olitorius]|uniref:Uncharacterized protein n=1 Tax=Corchorus olitorius TaxID=93759 RepID=A0A1R3GAM4_9ROSI|nr:hypothetical protein COLO4_36196 [Corchorus olitorius]